MNLHFRSSSCSSAAIFVLLAGLAGCETPGHPSGIAESALVPPPPVNQKIGFYDRVFTGFATSDCLNCHDGNGGTTCADPTQSCELVSLRHHMMLDSSSPRYKPQFSCADCHQPDAGTDSMTVTFNCQTCHSCDPHHTSAPAKARHCATCHGGIVNDFDDGHYFPLPKWKPAFRPDPNCSVWKDAAHTTCVAGGCRACHVASTAVTPNTWNNDQIHHGTGLGQWCNQPPEQCGWCHYIENIDGVPTPAIRIRTCETCHGSSSLHAIEYQYDTNKGRPGFGHVGADSDCWGCHGFFVKYFLPPAFGPTVPTIDRVSPRQTDAGVATEIVLTGQSFTNTVTEKGKTYNPTIVLSPFDEAHSETVSQVITPTLVTEGEIRFTATLPAGIFNLRVYKDYLGTRQMKSNDLPIVAKPNSSSLASAVLCGGTVTMAGTGFACPSALYVLREGFRIEQCTVSNCSGAAIVGSCPNAAAGDTLVVSGGGLPVGAALTSCP